MPDGDAHVVPVQDLIEHDTDTEDCVCGVAVIPVGRADGSFGWVFIHRSLDGRELGGDAPRLSG